jgi:hypothetical protein
MGTETSDVELFPNRMQDDIDGIYDTLNKRQISQSAD